MAQGNVVCNSHPMYVWQATGKTPQTVTDTDTNGSHQIQIYPSK